MRTSISSLFSSSRNVENARYENRREAGRFLARHLAEYKSDPAAIILALPRGGVPVAAEVAGELDLALDIFVVRKLGVPLFEELAMGAIASGGARILNEEIIRRLHITPQMIEAVTEEQQTILDRQEKCYRGDRTPFSVAGKKVILIDDGLATGASMRAAIQALRLLEPAQIIVAVPVGASEICEQLQKEVDRVICARAPESFQAVGQWYADFSQTRDEEVTELLNQAAHRHRVRQIAKVKRDSIPDLDFAVNS